MTAVPVVLDVCIDHLDLPVSDLARSRAVSAAALAGLGWEEVDGFHRRAPEAGALDNGPPGVRPQCSPGSYGAVVLDPDGHNVEAVFHEPQ